MEKGECACDHRVNLCHPSPIPILNVGRRRSVLRLCLGDWYLHSCSNRDTEYLSQVRKVRRSLRSLREKNDVHGLLGVLEVCVRDNFAGTESARLYSETFINTKNSIECEFVSSSYTVYPIDDGLSVCSTAYVNEVELALAHVRTSPSISPEEKRRFYRNANRNLGSSALCFSGGASFGFCESFPLLALESIS